jgi:hypothetical protein
MEATAPEALTKILGYGVATALELGVTLFNLGNFRACFLRFLIVLPEKKMHIKNTMYRQATGALLCVTLGKLGNILDPALRVTLLPYSIRCACVNITLIAAPGILADSDCFTDRVSRLQSVVHVGSSYPILPIN